MKDFMAVKEKKELEKKTDQSRAEEGDKKAEEGDEGETAQQTRFLKMYIQKQQSQIFGVSSHIFCSTCPPSWRRHVLT